MCVRVEYVSVSEFLPYDDTRNMINVPAHFEGSPYALLAVRHVLSQLEAKQPPSGAVCWCGEPVRLLARSTHQQTNGEPVVMRHGA